MADITKCSNNFCPKVSHCYRKTAKDSGRQSYSSFQFDEEDGYVTCGYYMATSIADWFEPEEP